MKLWVPDGRLSAADLAAACGRVMELQRQFPRYRRDNGRDAPLALAGLTMQVLADACRRRDWDTALAGLVLANECHAAVGLHYELYALGPAVWREIIAEHLGRMAKG